MAYGLILYKEFGNGKVEIYQNDYSGDATKIQVLAETPILNALDGSVTQIETPIIKSTCQFTIVDNGEFDFDDLFTSNATKYLVKLYDKPLSQYRQIWAGYLTPDSYATTYEPKSHITLIARDNLGMLADIDFDMTTEFSTPAQVITAMQTKIAWRMNTIDWICQQYKSGSTYIKDATISLLKYYDGDSHTWEEVVTDILRSLGQQLRYSSANQFSIVNIADIIDMQYSGVSLDYAIGNALSMEIIPSWRKYEVSQNYGKYSGYPTRSILNENWMSYIRNEQSSAELGWKTYNDFYSIQNASSETWKTALATTYGAMLLDPWGLKMCNYTFLVDFWYGTSTADNNKRNNIVYNNIDCPKEYLYTYRTHDNIQSGTNPYLYRDINISSGKGLSIVFEILAANWRCVRQSLIGNQTYLIAEEQDYTGVDTKLIASIGYIDANNVEWQMEESSWSQSSTPNMITFTENTKNPGVDSTVKFTINIASLPSIPGKLRIRIHSEQSSANRVNIYKSIHIQYADNLAGLDLTGAINENGNITEGLNISYGEVPAECGDALAYANGLFDSSDQHYALKNWVRNDGLSSSVTSLTELIARGISHHYSCFTNGGEVIGGKILRGTIPLEHVNLLKQIFVVRDEYYKVMYASVDVKQKQANVILRQVTDYVHHGSTTYTSTPVISGSDIVTTGTNQNLSWRATDVTIQGTKRVYELGDYSAVDGAYLLLDKSGWNDAVKYPLAQILNNIMTQTEKNILTGLLQLTQDCFVRWTASTSRFTAYSHGTITFTSGGVQVAQIHTIDENMTIEVGGGSGGSSTLAGLSDVDVTTQPLTSNDMLVYDGTGETPKWKNVHKNDLGFLTQHQSLAQYRKSANQDTIDAGLGNRITAIENQESTWNAKASANGTYPNMNVGAVINQTSGANAVKFATCTTATLPSTRDSDTIYFVV